MWTIFGLIVVGTLLFFGLVSLGAIGYLPDINELENPIDKYASQVISSDNELLFTYSQSNNNVFCRLLRTLAPPHQCIDLHRRYPLLFPSRHRHYRFGKSHI